MAVAVNRLEITDGVTTLRLIDGDNYYLQATGYAPTVSKLRKNMLGGGSPYEDVVETLSVYVTGSDAKEALTNLHRLSDMLNQAQEWGNRDNVDPVILRIFPHAGGNYVTQSIIEGLYDSTPIMSMSPSFVQEVNMYLVGPVSLRVSRRGQWLGANEQFESNEITLGAGNIIEAMTIALPDNIRGPVDLSIEGFKYQTGGVAQILDTYVLWARAGKILLYEAENMSFDGSMQVSDSELELDNVTTHASNGEVVTMLSTGVDPYPSEGTMTTPGTLVGTTLERVRHIAILAMVGCPSPTWVGSETYTQEWAIRGFGRLSGSGSLVYTAWKKISFESILTEMGQQEYRVKPVLLGTVSTYGGFYQLGIEAYRVSEVDSEPSRGECLSIDYLAFVDVEDPFTRIIPLDRYMVGSVAGMGTTDPYNVSLQTGALSLQEPVVSVIDGDTEERVFDKFALGDTWLEAKGSMDLVWFGHGYLSPSDGSWGASIPIGGTYAAPTALTLKTVMNRRKGFLVPQ